MEQKETCNDYPEREERTASFCLHHPILHISPAHCQQGTPHPERVLPTRKGRVGEAQASLAFGGITQGPTLVSPHLETSKAEMYRVKNKNKGKGYQSQPCSGSSQSSQ